MVRGRTAMFALAPLKRHVSQVCMIMLILLLLTDDDRYFAIMLVAPSPNMFWKSCNE